MFTMEDVAALKRAIATGVMKVRYADGREVTYRSQAELERALVMVEREAKPASEISRSFVAEF